MPIEPERLGYELNFRGLIPGKGRVYSIRHHIKISTGTNPAPYPMDASDSSPR
jgi:hypothetical protein